MLLRRKRRDQGSYRSPSRADFKKQATCTDKSPTEFARLEVATAGSGPIMQKQIDVVNSTFFQADAETKHLLIAGIQQAELQRFFVATFKDGSKKGVRPKSDDPFDFYAEFESVPARPCTEKG
jgi:hypothetical protein